MRPSAKMEYCHGSAMVFCYFYAAKIIPCEFEKLRIYLQVLQAFYFWVFELYLKYLINLKKYILIGQLTDNEEHFNKGAALNLGVREALKTGEFDCVVMHDVDVLPLNLRNDYSCRANLAMALLSKRFNFGLFSNGLPYTQQQ